MPDFLSFPENFHDIREKLPDGLSVSERIIDPVIIVDKVGPLTVARLAGQRMVKGCRQFYFSPSSRHAWVVDGTIIRPLPIDVSNVFCQRLNGADPENLRYSEVIRMIRHTGTSIEVFTSDIFRKAGKIVADELEGEITIHGLTAKLFPYQGRGVRWMQQTIEHTGGVILADEMGLGKTLQIIALLLINPPKYESPALIVCPTSLIANWQREFMRFAAGMTTKVHRGPNRTGIYRGLQSANVIITTYDTMLNDIEIFSSFEWSWLICDEAQAIKNPDSGRRKAIAKIPRQRTIPMTGTPVENSLLDLWSLADTAIPGLLGTKREFESTFPDSLESAQALGQLCDPVILKRSVADVAGDLPERINIDIPLELGDELVDLYLQVRKTTLERYPVAGALVATLQLQLLCAHPWLREGTVWDPEGENAEISPLDTYSLMTPKMERTVELLHEAFLNRRKVIIFSLYNRIGDLIRGEFSHIPSYWGAINGSTPQEQRQKIIDEFTVYDGSACLVLNPKAAGAGLNITAATVVIHFTPVWNPALEAQASARAHRRGQTKPVTVYRLYYIETVEEVMIERSIWKSELANESVPISTRDINDTKRSLEIVPSKI